MDSIRLPTNIAEVVLAATDASSIVDTMEIQSLWSGYGSIFRVELSGDTTERRPRSVIVKWVAPPTAKSANHPRGWNTNVSHQRKLHSYQVESNWYRDWSSRFDETIRVPRAHAIRSTDDQHIFVLEDLDASGFDQRRGRLDLDSISLGLAWLARFHANFLGDVPTGLWPTGTYWHLATRQEELTAMEPGPLQKAAAAIDRKLNECRYQTVVHGDAKVANFCFRKDRSALAAVDFQYVGGGCGMKDVAYFLSSCVDESECERNESIYLDMYFKALRDALYFRLPTAEIDEVESEWRQLYPFAWADFTRFLLGWCPEHQKLNRYSETMTAQVLTQLSR